MAELLLFLNSMFAWIVEVGWGEVGAEMINWFEKLPTVISVNSCLSLPTMLGYMLNLVYVKGI